MREDTMGKENGTKLNLKRAQISSEGVKWGIGWVVVGTAVFGACRKLLYFPGFWPKIGAPP